MATQKGAAKPKAGAVTIVNQQGLSDWLEEQINKQMGHAKANRLGERLSIDPTKSISVSTINKWRRKELERMDYTYIIGIARYENCTVDEIREWLEAPNGSSLKSFKRSQSGKPDSVSVRWQVQDLIQQLQELDDLSHTEKLAVISAVTQPLEIKKKIQLPEPWLRILDNFPEELIPTLYELGASLPDWKEKVEQVFKKEAVPPPSVISSVCFLLNLHRIELGDLSSEELKALFD